MRLGKPGSVSWTAAHNAAVNSAGRGSVWNVVEEAVEEACQVFLPLAALTQLLDATL
jgi:hypothetical protein